MLMNQRFLCLFLWEFIYRDTFYSVSELIGIAKRNPVTTRMDKLESELVRLSKKLESGQTSWSGSDWLSVIGGLKSKYGGIVLALENETIYSAASISEYAFRNNLFDPSIHAAIQRPRLKSFLNRVAAKGQILLNPDGSVPTKGQRDINGAKGIRWKKAFVNM